MPDGHGNRYHFGPEPNFGSGAQNVHAQIHERAIGKTVARVYLGDAKPFRALHPKDFSPDGMFRSEYLIIEFTDGSTLPLSVGSGNSFALLGDNAVKEAREDARRAKRER